jgi:hypothetical protein
MRQEWDFNIRRGVHYEDGKDCPGKYSCDGLEPSSTNCYFRGKTYQDSEAVDSTLASPSCNAGCHCRVEGKYVLDRVFSFDSDSSSYKTIKNKFSKRKL